MSLAALDKTDRQRIGLLVDFAVAHLWYTSPDAENDDHGCCPVCCGPCTVLAGLYGEGKLDAWLLESSVDPAKSYTWDPERGQLDRNWLLRSWEKANALCCHDEVYAVAAVALVLDRLRQDIET